MALNLREDDSAGVPPHLCPVSAQTTGTAFAHRSRVVPPTRMVQPFPPSGATHLHPPVNPGRFKSSHPHTGCRCPGTQAEIASGMYRGWPREAQPPRSRRSLLKMSS
jgi:hypothetical protein